VDHDVFQICLARQRPDPAGVDSYGPEVQVLGGAESVDGSRPGAELHRVRAGTAKYLADNGSPGLEHEPLVTVATHNFLAAAALQDDDCSSVHNRAMRKECKLGAGRWVLEVHSDGAADGTVVDDLARSAHHDDADGGTPEQRGGVVAGAIDHDPPGIEARSV